MLGDKLDLVTPQSLRLQLAPTPLLVDCHVLGAHIFQLLQVADLLTKSRS